MVLDWKQRVTNEELDALTSNSVNYKYISIDKWAPLRFWIVLVVMAAFAIWLLTSPVEIAGTLTKIPTEENKLSAYLYSEAGFWFAQLRLVPMPTSKIGTLDWFWAVWLLYLL